MKNMENLKGKVKETAIEVKDWASENKGAIIAYGACAGILVGSIVLGQRKDKKISAAWRAAKEAYDNGNLDHNFGPYKVMKFFEPKTGEFIGETMCHENTVEAFLNVK